MTQPPKGILFICKDMSGGGAERVVLEVLTHLDRSRFRPVLGLFRRHGVYLDSLPGDVNVEVIGKPGGITGTPSFAKRINALVDQHDIGVISSHLTTINTSVLRADRWSSAGRPVVVTEHNNPHRQFQSNSNPLSLWVRLKQIGWLYKGAAAVTCVSQGIREQIIEHWSVPDPKAVVIYNPVDLQSITQKQSEPINLLDAFDSSLPVIVAAGRFIEQKRFDILLRAFAQLRQDTDCRLVILGSGELQAQYEKLIDELGVADRVHLPGFQNNPWAVFAQAQLFVLSSGWEGFGNVLIEAMACGTPVVSTDCDYGPSEIITHDKNGLLTPVGDAPALAAAMRRVLTEPGLSQRLSDAGSQRAKDFDSKRIVAKYEELFDTLMKRGGPA